MSEQSPQSSYPAEDPFPFFEGLSPDQKEEFRRAFTQSLDDAVAEADRDGWFTLQEVLAECDAIIVETKRRRGG